MASTLGKRLDGLTHSYPSALDEVRDLFDLTIIRDLEEREGSKAPARIELLLGCGTQRILRASSQAVPGDLQSPGGKWPVCGC